MVFFHKFFLLRPESFRSKMEAKRIAATCLFIAVKANYGFISVEKIATAACSLINGCEETGEKIINSELKILVKIGFDLEIELPYRFLEGMIDYMRKHLKENLRTFLQTTTNFINDSFKIPLCLNYEPNLIALTSILLTAKLFNMNLPDENGVKWYNLIDKTIKYDTLLEIGNLLNNMYIIVSTPHSKKEEFDINLIYNSKKEVLCRKKPTSKLKK